MGLLVVVAVLLVGWWLLSGAPMPRKRITCRVCGEQAVIPAQHSCAGGARVADHVRWVRANYSGGKRPIGYLAGELRNERGEVVWECNHQHRSRKDADKCAEQHLSAHQQGRCACVSLRMAAPRAERGYDAADSAIVYLLHHPRLAALKVGKSRDDGEARIRSHEREGWYRIAVSPEISPEAATRIEQQIIAAWRRAGHPPAVLQAAMPQGGFSETVATGNVSREEAERQLWATLSSVLGAKGLVPGPRQELSRDEIRTLRLGFGAVPAAHKLVVVDRVTRATSQRSERGARTTICGLSERLALLRSLTHDAASWTGWTVLVADPNHPRIAVMIRGERVGYVSTARSKALAPYVEPHWREGVVVVAKASITRGKDNRIMGHLWVQTRPIPSAVLPLAA